MLPDYVTWMAIANDKRSLARSALPDAPVIDDVVDRMPRQPRLAGVRIRLARIIWPGELARPAAQQPSSVANC